MVEETFRSLEEFRDHFTGRENDLQQYLADARKFWNTDDLSRVKIDGSRSHMPVFPAPAPILDRIPLRPWPVPYYQEENRSCAFNALRNLGLPVPDNLEASGLKYIINYLDNKGKVSLQ